MTQEIPLALAVAVAGAAGCGGGADVPPAAQVMAPVVYGADDRQDYFEASDQAFAELLRGATVALVDPRYIDVSDPDDVAPKTVTLGEYKDLCDGERFAEQPAMASCSGTLIDDDLVLTAAHCVDATVCAEWYFVFGFYMSGPEQLNPMSAADVYTCAEIVLREYTEDAGEDTWHDYAVVRLDRAVDDRRAPARVARDPGALRIGDGLTALGFGNGIPGKVHGGASVHRAIESWGYFVGSTDTFSANSGSGTYNDDHELVGVFVRGGDNDYRRSGNCSVVNVLAESEATQEYDYAAKVVADLCARGYASARLCGVEEDPTPDAEPADPAEPGPEARDEAAGPELSSHPSGSSDGCGAATGGHAAGPLAVMMMAMMMVARRRGRVRGSE